MFICAWCKNRIGRGRKPEHAIVNWGMCRLCLREKIAALPAAAGRHAKGADTGEPGAADRGQVQQRPAA
jgi:hypothetical protein